MEEENHWKSYLIVKSVIKRLLKVEITYSAN